MLLSPAINWSTSMPVGAVQAGDNEFEGLLQAALRNQR